MPGKGIIVRQKGVRRGGMLASATHVKRSKTVKIIHIDNVRDLPRIPDGWYRVQGVAGLTWHYYRNGHVQTVVEGDEYGYNNSVVGCNNSMVGWELRAIFPDLSEDEFISRHKKHARAVEAAEKWIRAHPRGE